MADFHLTLFFRALPYRTPLDWQFRNSTVVSQQTLGFGVTLRLQVYCQSVRVGAKPLETHDQYYFSTEHLQLWFLCNILSDWRMGLSFTIAAGLRQRILGSASRGTHGHILLSHIRDSPNLKDQVPVFISPRIRVVQLYPQALGSIFFASYGSRGYGANIRPRPHSSSEWVFPVVFRITPLHRPSRKQRF
jgi:hypothetical protein